MATEWIDLEPGSFAASGTNVNAAIAVFEPTEEYEGIDYPSQKF